jgi:endonuclease/exonuclease/phosphatase family metal-dependent hydrolase
MTFGKKRSGIIGLPGSAFLGAAVVVLTAAASTAGAGTAPVRFASYNLYHGDGATGPRAWSNRRPFAMQQVHDLDPDVIGFQEVRKDINCDATGCMLDQVTSDLVSTYSRVPIPSTYLDQVRAPQSIFYRASKFTVLNSGYWVYDLSGVSMSDECRSVPYSMMWARLNDKATGQRYLVVSTHLTAGTCPDARLEEAKQLKNRIAVILRDNEWTAPVVVLGDFNSGPPSDPIAKMKEEKSYVLANGTTHSYKLGYGNEIPTINAGWQTGTGQGTTADDTTIFDYVWYQTSKLSRTATGVDRRMFMIDNDWRSPSDHYLVWANLKVD